MLAAGAAAALLGALAPAGPAEAKRIAPGVTWTKVVKSEGPLRYHVLTVDRSRARLAAVLSNGRAGGRERVSAMARRSRAIAGVNGGFFGADGNPVGVLAVRGRLVSEPVAPRSALLLPRTGRAGVAELRFAGGVRVGTRTRLLDGVDRLPGRIPACGGRGGDRPTQRPDATRTCTDPSELVLFDAAWGAATPAGATEVLVRGGVASAPRRSGSRPRRGDLLLWGSGDAARFLRSAVPAGSRPRVDLSLRAGTRTVRPEDHEAIVGGGPRLLRGGLVRVGSAAEGFGMGAFFRAFVASPNPRTLAGVRPDGRVLLVTVDGRRRGWSTGLSLAAAARLMRSLGARDALNLDGGGSTAMTVGPRVVSRPSDPGGERPVSDGLFVLR